MTGIGAHSGHSPMDWAAFTSAAIISTDRASWISFVFLNALDGAPSSSAMMLAPSSYMPMRV